ncbi:MAG: 23S rRNA (pseudouridine(1915)-N(3))-methyltransferase RlmH [Gammaproteobacteria bacterium]|nr:23S rRNA (pseudouridine(1915)-N(3))-methyltransferase RlmH [Gammaproteobacteria bacterium]
MRLSLIVTGNRPERWVSEGCNEFLKRIPAPYAPEIIELPPSRKHAQNPQLALAEEARQIIRAVRPGARLVVLDERGKAWSTRDLAERWQQWQHQGQDVALVIGGASGCAEQLKADAEVLWSLSALTLPHMIVRLMVIEQLYRAWSLLTGHPYHRD